MAVTLETIARLIHEGDMTLAECSARLGITRDQLDTRLRLMERQGYLTRNRHGVKAGEECSCGHCCALCCRSRHTVPVPDSFILTPKGMRLIAAAPY
ncbi:MAG: hypothetical protein GYA23_04180 [Methanomicrobiales archaeon]|nr:hypothetical protein [Methanomicrobiales archaeon]